jgi:hypothetical protein
LRTDRVGHQPTSQRAAAAPQPVRASDVDGPSPSASGLGFAWAPLIDGLLHGAVSVYWGLGRTWLLDTVGGSLEEQGRAGNSGVMLGVGCRGHQDDRRHAAAHRLARPVGACRSHGVPLVPSSLSSDFQNSLVS